ncbi:universal stress protein [Pseudarthrobacter sp. AG30]|uniref:universal stress protein n=1 Tax=Pseudarthrobacter sp. AG30 TaxID=2249742 RepID=UPI000D641DF7|nr:universal stress protein [Pseudarthrobacter sp. AG30]RAX18183.1 universal stress protein [Pseudarthrobacter sp. AG30]
MAPAKPIAVGITNTPASDAALMWAAARADRLKAPLAVVTVVDDRWMASEVLPYFEVLRESGLGLLKEAGEKVSAAYPGLSLSLKLLEGGVGSALGAYSKEAAMLVLGTSGHSRGALTDRALQAAATAECPVAVIGGGQEAGRGVFVGVDGSEESTQAVAYAAAEADMLGEELTVLYAFTGPNRWIAAGLPSSSFATHVLEEEQIVLAETEAGLRQDYPDLTVHTVMETVVEPAAALVRAASGARLLVLGSRGKGGFERLLLGSTVHAVLAQPPCPTIITRMHVPQHGD